VTGVADHSHCDQSDRGCHLEGNPSAVTAGCEMLSIHKICAGGRFVAAIEAVVLPAIASTPGVGALASQAKWASGQVGP
jgi:hypothetical protein